MIFLEENTKEELTHPIKVWFNPVIFSGVDTSNLRSEPELLNDKLLRLQIMLNYFNETKTYIHKKASQLLFGIQKDELKDIEDIINNGILKRKPLPEKIVIPNTKIRANVHTFQYEAPKGGMFVYVYVDYLGNAYITNDNQDWLNLPHIKQDLEKLNLRDTYLTGYLVHETTDVNTISLSVIQSWLFSLDTKLFINDFFDPARPKTTKSRLFDFRKYVNLNRFEYLDFIDYQIGVYNPDLINKPINSINYNSYIQSSQIPYIKPLETDPQP